MAKSVARVAKANKKAENAIARQNQGMMMSNSWLP